MSDRFALGSSFNADANFKSVKVGAGSYVLETELNELQDISYYRQQQFVKDYIGDGLMNIGSLSYKDGFLTLDNEVAVVGGYLIDITHLSCEILRGHHAYLKVWEEEKSYTDIIKFKGNAQESRVVANSMWDERVNEETTRRIQIMYDLVTDNSDKNAAYLDIGYLGADTFNVTVSTKGHNTTKFTYECIAKEGQTVIDFPRAYAFGKSTMLVFIDGLLLMPEDYVEVDSKCIRFNIEIHEGQKIFCYAENYIKPIVGEGHAETHMVDGNDPLDITDLKDEEDLLDKLRGLLGKVVIDGGGFGDLDTERDTVYSGGLFTDSADILDPSLPDTGNDARELEIQVSENKVLQYRYKGETLWTDLIDFKTLQGTEVTGLDLTGERLMLKNSNGTFGNAINFPNVIDALTSTSAINPLSANQGKALKALIDNIHTGGGEVDTSKIEANLKTYVDTLISDAIGGEY